jgi:hypothetical protein
MNFLNDDPIVFCKCITKDFQRKVLDIHKDAQLKMKYIMPVVFLEEDDIIKDNVEMCFRGEKLEFLGTLFGLKLYSYWHVIPKIEMFKF